MEELDYGEIQKVVENILPERFPVTFGELVTQLLSGDTKGIGGILSKVGKWLLQGISFPVESGIKLLGLLLFAALFANVARAFTKNGVSHLGFLCVYLLLAVSAVTGFQACAALVNESVANVCKFVEVLVPTYCISIAFLTGTVTAAGYYQGTVFAIALLQYAVRYLFLPLTKAYLLIALASGMQKKPMFTRLLELLETVFSWAQKTLLGLVVAMGSVQGFLLPAIDKVKRNAVVKTAGAIPGVGSLLEGAWETVLGSGVVLKNAIGITGALLLFLVCSIPLATVGLQYLMYRVVAAAAEPVTEEATAQFLLSIGAAHRLLFQTLFLSFVLFLLLLVVMTRISA